MTRKFWGRGSEDIGATACNHNGGMKLRVECYAGSRADERPVRFWLDERGYMVEEVVDQWYGSSDAFFKVRADDGNLYILRLDQSASVGGWSLESFRELG
jgi:hypothetical protein